MDVMSAAAERERIGHRRVLHLEVGQPASGAPTGAIRAASKALTTTLGYTVALGENTLRARIARMYEERYGVHLTPEQIAVTSGSSGAFVAALTCLWDTNDRVVCPLPGYPCYRNVLTALGMQVVPIETHVSDRYTPTVEQLQREEDRGGPLSGLIVASPSNPTGCCITKERLRELADFCSSRNMHFICDEIYHGITFRPVASALEVSNNIIVISSMSKYQCMPGWRLGYVVCRDPDIMRYMERLLQNMQISAPAISQRAAIGALDCSSELDLHVERYARNIEILAKKLPAIGFDGLFDVDGAFYVYANATKVMRQLNLSSSVELCRVILEETDVAITPGVDFDPVRGHDFVRFSVAGATHDIREAAQRLQDWVAAKVAQQ